MGLFGKRRVEAQVSGLAWSRVIQLEESRWDAKRSFGHPFGEVRNVKRHTEEYWATVTDTQPGTPDANGIPGPPTTTMRQELRSRDYYTYEALVWHAGRKLTEAGTDPSKVKWPAYTLGSTERVRSQAETYQATFTAGEKQFEKNLPEVEWQVLEPGGSYQLSLGIFGGVKHITPSQG